MVKNFDHVTIVVQDLEAAKQFFEQLGFEHVQSVVISGKVFSDYMGIPDIEADHVTLVLKGANPREEVQLLHYRTPHAEPNPNIEVLDKIGFNHICFAVEDLESELERLQAAGIETRSEVLKFRGCKLVFLRGPEGITVELSEQRNADVAS